MGGNIIGLIGAQGSGKDTVANLIAENSHYRHIKFAKVINDVADELGLGYTDRVSKETPVEFIWEGEFSRKYHPTAHRAFGRLVNEAAYLFSWELRPYQVGESKYLLSPRKGLQLLGTQVGRTLHEDIWVDAALNNEAGDLVISDVRFVNEALSCDWLLYIKRPGYGFDDDHVSERLARTFDQAVGGVFPEDDDVVSRTILYCIRSKLIVLDNDSDLDVLEERVKLFLERDVDA